MFGDYIQAFNSDLTSVVQFTGVAILVLGFSNFIWYDSIPSGCGIWWRNTSLQCTVSQGTLEKKETCLSECFLSQGTFNID
jgi:hypothetical protein